MTPTRRRPADEPLVVVRRPAADGPKAPAPAAGIFPPGRVAELPEDRGYTSDLSAGWMP